MEWLDTGQIRIVPPPKPKKITGTRFAAILGKNTWNTPFKAWCEITRTYEEPFEDTVYTVAGKTIEPRQADYMRRAYFMTGLKTPTDIFGGNYFQKTWGDFFGDTPIFGGMWDYLLYDERGKPEAVLEMKTTKRAEDWERDIPEYYALQAALYAYLLGVDQVIMVASFLEEKDYADPTAFLPSSENTAVIPFRLSERYPDFGKLVGKAKKWWKECVEGGVSPAYDEKKDADILRELRKNSVCPETDLAALIEEAEHLQIRLDAVSRENEEGENRLKVLREQIKEASRVLLRPGDKEVVVHGVFFDWTTSRTVSMKIDEEKMRRDGVLERYKTLPTETVKLTPKKRKE